MKKMFVAILIAFISFSAIPAFAQKDSIKIDYAYAGMLSNVNFPTEKFPAIEKGVSVRVGGGATWIASKHFQVQSWTVFDYDGMSTAKGIMFAGIIKPVKKITIAFGNIPSLSATVRPVPCTAAGHFETWTHSQLTGVLPGAWMKFSFGKKNDVATGVAYNHDKMEIHGRLKIGSWTTVGYWNANQKNWAVSTGFDFSRFSLRMVQTDSVFAFFESYTVWDKYHISLYFDGGDGYKNGVAQSLREEFGVLKSFEKPEGTPFSGLFGLGYANELKAVRCYLHIFL